MNFSSKVVISVLSTRTVISFPGGITVLRLTNTYVNMDASDQQAARDRRVQEQQDHEFALRLAGYDVSNTGDDTVLRTDEDLARDLYENEFHNLVYLTKSLSITERSSGDSKDAAVVEDQPGDTDATAFDRRRAPKDCIACHDKPGAIAVPCNHRYCADCLTEVLRTAMADGTAFPPRCCRQEIPVAVVRAHLDRTFVQEFEKKAVELASANQIYCYKATCSAFIPTDTICGAGNAQCPDCGRWTCMHCKGRRHHGDCPEDEGVQQLIQMANQEGWRRCECGRMIELNIGCNHMTVSLALSVYLYDKTRANNFSVPMQT